MAPKILARNLICTLAALVMWVVVSAPSGAPAAPTTGQSASSALTTFADSVVDGKSTTVRGVYTAGLFAFPVVQQPNYEYVSMDVDTATEFLWAKQNGVIGLLSHNFLGGEKFGGLHIGEEIDVVYGDGRIDPYHVTARYEFRTMTPWDPSSTYMDLETGKIIDGPSLSMRFYAGRKHVTLQTCISKGGDWDWGRLFIVAEPGPGKVIVLPGMSGALLQLR